MCTASFQLHLLQALTRCQTPRTRHPFSQAPSASPRLVGEVLDHNPAVWHFLLGVLKFDAATSIFAPLFLMMYCTSLMGKVEDSGRAIALVPRIARRLTEEISLTLRPVCIMRTHVVVVIPIHKCNPLTTKRGIVNGTSDLVTTSHHITDQLAVGKLLIRPRMNDSRTFRIMLFQCLKDG